MNKALYALAWAICFFCASEWFFRPGLRIYLYESAAALFLALALLSRGPAWRVPAHLAWYLRLKWLWLALAALTGLAAAFAPVSYSAPALFAKAFVQALFHTAFFSCLALYVCSLPDESRARLARAYLWGALAAVSYGILQGVLFRSTGFDTDRLLWAPFNVPFAADMGVARQVYGPFVRIKGWAGEPNLLAAYALSALPLAPVLLRSAAARAGAVFLLGLGLLLTMSLSGLGGALIAISLSLSLGRGGRAVAAKTMLLYAAPLLLLAALFPAELSRAAANKLAPGGTVAGHVELIKTSLAIASRDLSGHGFGNYSAVFENETSVANYNAHSSWMNYLVETGLPGLLLQAGLAVFVFLAAVRRGPAGRAFAAAWCGLCAAGMFYNTLDSFFVNLFAVLFLTLSLREADDQEIPAEPSGKAG